MVIQERYIDRSSVSIKEYLKEVSRIPRLTSEEETKYAILAAEGDEIAKTMLVKSNLRFVISIAKQFQSNKMQLADLINEGNVGLIESANTFDSTRGFKFISYAIWGIKGKLLAYVKENNDIYKIPNNQIGNIVKLKKIISTLEGQLCRDVYPEDLYGNIEDMSDMVIDNTYDLIKYKTVSMSQQHGDDDGLTLGDSMPSSSYDDTLDSENQEYNFNLLCDLVDGLESRLRILMNHCHGLNGHDKIGERGYAEKFDLTITRVQQLHKIAIRHLRLIGTGKKVKLKAPQQREVVSKIIDKYTKPDVVGKPLSEDREDIDEMIAKTDYVIRGEKPKKGFINLMKVLFN